MIQYPDKDFWKIFKGTTGAMSCAEAIFMYNVCLQAPNEYVWVEMGTHKCKSALVSLMAWVDRKEHPFFLLEPEFGKLDFLTEAQSAVLKFKGKFGGNTTCNFVTGYSTDFLRHGVYSYIMWDSGNHGEDLVQSEKALLQDKVVSGGVVVLHDLNSQFTAVTRAYEQLIASGNYEPITFNWDEIFEYVKENNLEEGNDSWHQYPELPHPPNFIGALRRK